MLTTELVPSGGDAVIDRLSLVKNPVQIRKNLGYCPQFDGLNGTLTAAEHVTYYAKLRGIEPNKIPTVVDWIINEINLNEYRYKNYFVKNYFVKSVLSKIFCQKMSIAKKLFFENFTFYYLTTELVSFSYRL